MAEPWVLVVKARSSEGAKESVERRAIKATQYSRMTISRDVACFLPLLQSGPRLPINTQGSAKPPPWAKFLYAFGVLDTHATRWSSFEMPDNLPNQNETAICMSNSAEWCDRVCRAHGVPGTFTPEIWFQPRVGSPYYSNAITLTRSGLTEQYAAIAQLKEALPLCFS